MTASFWQERLARCPAVRPWLLRVARRAAGGGLLPATLTLGDVPAAKDVRRELEELFPGCRAENGRLKVRLAESERAPEPWLPLAALLGVRSAPPVPGETPEERLARCLLRLRVLHPDELALVEAMRRSDVFLRLFRTAADAPRTLEALAEAVLFLRAAPPGVTLSELGARCLGDSKALRGGPLRQAFEHLLRLQSGNPDDDAAALFAANGIIENPYTTHVVVFAPFAYRAADGAWLDWPLALWRRGEAAILSWRSVRLIEAVRLDESCGCMVTSENAAPFHRLVETRRPALYTEGYPNAAVKTLLRHFARADVTALHWGDTDLDGYRIAEQVARAIPTELYDPETASPALAARRVRLTHDQRRRLSAFIDAHPEFPYLDCLRRTLAQGWIEQEQSIDVFT